MTSQTHPQEVPELVERLTNAYIATRTPAAPKTPDWAMVRQSLECELFVRSLPVILNEALTKAAPPVDGDLRHVIDRDRYVAAACLGAIDKVLESRAHLAEPGRGSYEWDDERYQQEFGLALDEIREALQPLRRLARDKSDCTTDPEKVIAARVEGAERFAALQQSRSTPGAAHIRDHDDLLGTLIYVSTALPVLKTMLRAIDLSIGESKADEMIRMVQAALDRTDPQKAASPVPVDASGERAAILAHMRWWSEQGGDAEPGWLNALIGQIESGEHANPAPVAGNALDAGTVEACAAIADEHALRGEPINEPASYRKASESIAAAIRALQSHGQSDGKPVGVGE